MVEAETCLNDFLIFRKPDIDRLRTSVFATCVELDIFDASIGAD
jgi:hypothetical protein